MTEWYSIDNPPKSGELQLVVLLDTGYDLAAYDGATEMWYNREGYTVFPTHWIRLPEPPPALKMCWRQNDS